MAQKANAESMTLKTKKDEEDLLYQVLRFDYSAVDDAEEGYLHKAGGEELEDAAEAPSVAAVASTVGAFGSAPAPAAITASLP